MGKKKRHKKRIAVEKRKEKVRVEVEEVVKKISTQNLYSSEITGILSDAQKVWHEKMSPIFDAQEVWHEKMKPIFDAQEAWHEKMSPIIEIQNSMHEKIQPIIEMYNKIDWDLLREAVAEEIKELEDILVEQEEIYWCLDIGTATAIVNGEIAKDDLSEYMDENLESTITKIVQDPIYELHATLIQEAYEAYKVGFYKLCAMPLFAALEHVVAMWYLGYIKEEMILVNQYPNIGGLKYKINPDKFNHVELENLNRIFVFSVFRTYRKLFDDIPDQLSQKLNRNAISHGYYDYDSISKTDILKLFQILKSAMILKSFDRNKVAES
ncbi:hypothetical protein [Bacillus thuringiensis]|uniref:hypothetical protein n=1 Tax=Bacillus thuringiensis TaxID=1428 RepID=UPI00211E25FE|nr:hypothetical protein [Bacillus thuringiensis]